MVTRPEDKITLREQFIKILIKFCDHEVKPFQFTEDLSFVNDQDVIYDSLDLVEILMACEELFDIEVTDDEAEHLITFGRAIEYLEERVDPDALLDDKFKIW